MCSSDLTIKRRPRPQWRRRIAALLAAAAVIYIVAATASSASFSAAWETLGQQGALALTLLERSRGLWL